MTLFKPPNDEGTCAAKMVQEKKKTARRPSPLLRDEELPTSGRKEEEENNLPARRGRQSFKFHAEGTNAFVEEPCASLVLGDFFPQVDHLSRQVRLIIKEKKVKSLQAERKRTN